MGISQEDGKIVIRPAVSKALRYQGIAGKAKDGTVDWEEIRQKAWEEHRYARLITRFPYRSTSAT